MIIIQLRNFLMELIVLQIMVIIEDIKLMVLDLI